MPSRNAGSRHLNAAIAGSRHDAYVELARGVALVPLSLVNAYLLGRPGAPDGTWVVVDAGTSPLSARAILRAAEARFGARSRPGAIILTHGHFDHVGGLRALLEAWDDPATGYRVPVYAHRLELPYLDGRSPYPPADPSVGGGAMSSMSFLYPRGPFHFGGRVRPLPEDGTVPGPATSELGPDIGGWRWVATPGHSPGHVSLWRELDRVLVVGDAFVTTKQESMVSALTRWPAEVHGPPKYFTPDWGAARESVRALARLDPELAATGHGRALRGFGLRQQLRELAREFDAMARPARGRYVEEPAVTDLGGVVSVPAASVVGAAAPLIAAAALGMGLGVLSSYFGRGRRTA